MTILPHPHCLPASLQRLRLGPESRIALALARQHGERGHEAYALYALAEVADATSPSGVATAYRDAADLATILGMRPLLALCLRCACQAMGPDRRDPEGSAATHLPSEQA